MPSGTECVCCKEITQIPNKTSSEGVGCITLHPGFQGVCLNPWVLETAYYTELPTALYGEHAVEGDLNKYTVHGTNNN